MSIHWGGRGAGHVNRLPRAIGALSPFSGATMLLDFTNPVLDPRITFSRGTGATRVNASGFIEVVGNTTPRFDYDPVTLAPRGLLIEEARTNLLTYSEQIDNVIWVKQNTTVTVNSTASPDGTVNADTIVSNTTNDRHIVNNTFAGATLGTTYAVSMYVKKGTQRYCVFGDAGDSLWRLITFDFDTQTITGTTNVTTSSATAVGNGWFRLTITATRALTASYQIFAGFSNASTNAAPPLYVGSTSDNFYVWGAQVEVGGFATSYIPTVASTVSRSADVATMTGTNFSTWYNQAAGTFVTDFDKQTTAARGAAICAGDTTALSASNIAIDGQNNGKVRAYIERGGGVEMSNLTLADYAANIPIKAAIAYATNDAVGAAAGALGTVDTSVILPTLDIFQIGAIRNSTSPANTFLNGHIRAIAYYNTRLPNTQLQTLTAPSLASPLALDFISPTYTVGY